MDWTQFLGRFHPLIVHLPIGFLVFGLLLECLNYFLEKKYQGLDQSIQLIYLASAISAIGAAIIGLLLSASGGYDEQTLFWHQWLGFTLIIFCLGAWWLKTRLVNKKRMALLLATGLLVWVLIVGHLGGSLTHGEDYLLTHAPGPVKRLFGLNEKAAEKALPENTDSIFVFKHLIAPVLSSKCTSCHNPQKAKGGLDLSNPEAIQKGGNDGSVIVKGNSASSELFHRITLPHSSSKFMPISGEPLSYAEIRLIQWWINNGADFTTRLTGQEFSAEMLHILNKDFGLQLQNKSVFESISAPALDTSILAKANSQGIFIERLSDQKQLVEVKITSAEFTAEQSALLSGIAGNIVKLHLSGIQLSPEALKLLPKLSNLVFLNLSRSNISDRDLQQISTLKKMEVLNLYGTSIGDESAPLLSELKALKTLYVWQSALSSQAIEKLQAGNKNMEIIGGAE